MSPVSGNSEAVFTTDSRRLLAAGTNSVDEDSGFIGYVAPVFYLTSDVVITGGAGTESDPYQITK